MSTPETAGYKPYVQHHVQMVIKDPGGSKRYVELETRAISPSRLTFVAQVFCHMDSVAVIDLPKADGSCLRIKGIIKDCIHSKGRLHAALLEFESKLDLTQFFPPTPKSATTQQTQQTDPASSTDRPPVKALYIDDHDADRMLMKHRTKGTHITLETVESSGAACDQLKTEIYDIVLCDYHLDDINGIDVLTQIRSFYTGPVIFTTAESSVPEFEKMIEAGATSVLTKPIGLARLNTTIEAALDTADDKAALRLDPFDAPSTDAELTRSYIPVLMRMRDEFTRAKAKRNIEIARTVCRSISGSAAGYGLTRLARSAERSLAAIDAAGNLDLAGKPVKEFVHHLGVIIEAANANNAVVTA